MTEQVVTTLRGFIVVSYPLFLLFFFFFISFSLQNVTRSCVKNSNTILDLVNGKESC